MNFVIALCYSVAVALPPTIHWQATPTFLPPISSCHYHHRHYDPHRGGRGAVAPPPLNFGLSENCRKIFFLSEI